MEVGAVKQAFNNEVILLKRSLNQARIQVIHKLTRKAKVLLSKKAPEKLQTKLKRKAEAAVNEVMILKTIKPKDLAKFIVTHKDDLNKHINKPTVDIDKACARLLLNKALQDKYKQMRVTYLNIPIDDLFMSRLERQKIKKEKKELMNKKNHKNNSMRVKKNSISSEGDWSVEDVQESVNSCKIANDDSANDSKIADNSDDESGSDNERASDSVNSDEDTAENKLISKEIKETRNKLSTKTKLKAAQKPKNSKEISKNDSTEIKLYTEQQLKEDKRTKLPKINKQKNKKSDNKLHKKKHIKEKEEPTVIESAKVVDPFFKTVTGECYMSLVEPRTPDEVKEIHYQGNRQMRRAVMFGHAPRMKPRQNFRQDNSNYNRFNKDDNGNKSNYRKNYNGGNYNNSDVNNFKKNDDITKEATREEKPEKLHPSWEAKKKRSNILPFQDLIWR